MANQGWKLNGGQTNVSDDLERRTEFWRLVSPASRCELVKRMGIQVLSPLSSRYNNNLGQVLDDSGHGGRVKAGPVRSLSAIHSINHHLTDLSGSA